MNDVLDKLDEPVIIEPSGPVTASVIWLHGLGADGHDFEPIVPELNERMTEQVRFVFPHAPMQPITINGGTLMRAWYDLAESDGSLVSEESGVRESEQILRALIEAEIEQGVPPERVVLAGFSQGGAIALHTGIRFEQPLAGIMALSTYLPVHESVKEQAAPANASIPIFMAHGSEDPLIPLEFSDLSQILLTGLGYPVELHTYLMPHSISPEEIRDIDNWLERLLLEPIEPVEPSRLILPGG